MVSFHKVLAETPPPPPELKLSSNNNKRKWEQQHPLLTTQDFFFKDLSKSSSNDRHQKISKSIFDIQFHLQTPLPSPPPPKLQSLNVQSAGDNINLSNTKMMNVKNMDSKVAPETVIDLELNLTCESLRRKDKNETKKDTSSSSSQSQSPSPSSLSPSSHSRSLQSPLPSWLLAEGEEQKEMVATVCMRCHMLVMLCKSSPSCPNCKFMHPPDQNPSFLKRKRCKLLDITY